MYKMIFLLIFIMSIALGAFIAFFNLPSLFLIIITVFLIYAVIKKNLSTGQKNIQKPLETEDNVEKIRHKYNLKDKNKIYDLNKKTRVIYKITNSKNGKAYIGKTINSFNERYSGQFKSHNKNLQREIDYYGLGNFTVELLEEDLEPDEIDSIEKYYIRVGKNLYNIVNN